ncbi:MAG: hypothetical protein OEV00_04660 [Acidobacteriota bacterium]|nr:hypothetical protein [Acidobacteriota bacterium]MDH3784605.1 hypothetical protein [Acidobacteriota bacterium]
MSHRRNGSVAEIEPRVLTKTEIDHRIAAVCADCSRDGHEDPRSPMTVRWITAAELVARVAPLLSKN